MNKPLLALLLMGSVLTANGQSNMDNPLLKKWVGPYGGVPAFNEYSVSDIQPAMEIAIQKKLSEIIAISENKEPATFENTIAALELAGKELARINTVYGIYSSNLSSPEFEPVETEMTPRLYDLNNKIYQNQKLFQRIEALYKAVDKSKLTQEQQRLTEFYYKNFIKEGARLDSKAKDAVAGINQRLAALFTKFSQNLLAEENNQFLELESEKDFDGLPSENKKAAIADAKDRNLAVMGIIANTRSSIEPFLTFSSNRELREKAWRMFVSRGDNNNANDNNAIIVEILKLRAEKAKLLGFPTFAHWSLSSNTMAKTPEKTMELMLSVWNPAVEKVHEDVAAMQKIISAERGEFKLAPWDYRYYSEKVRKAKYDLDQNEVKPYLQLEKLREGMFWVAGELFDLKFKQVVNVPVFHSDVRVWEVTNGTSGKLVGLWYFDPYARTGKRSGAWMNNYRDQQRLDGDVLTIVSNNSNFIKGSDDEPVLISWDDATTLFHEFGHALHGLCSDVNYPSLSGTSVARDYVEFPSQILERWLATPEVLKKFALHFKTNEPLPQALVDRIEKAATFNEGFSTVETISSSLIDMKLHLEGDKPIDPDAFERETLAKLNMPEEIVMRHRIPQFGHIFSGDDYAAGYYSYLWSDVISADAWEAFVEKGAYDKGVAKRLYEHVFSVGNTIDPAEGYKKFRGKEASTDALMRSRNFPIVRK